MVFVEGIFFKHKFSKETIQFVFNFSCTWSIEFKHNEYKDQCKIKYLIYFKEIYSSTQKKSSSKSHFILKSCYVEISLNKIQFDLSLARLLYSPCIT